MRRSRKVGLALVLALMVVALAVGVVLARGPGGGVGARGFHAGSDSPVQILSDLSGVPVDDIHAARLEGKSLLEIAEANGVAGDELTAAVVGVRTAAIDALVEAGTITQERADALKARLTERVGARLARSGPRGGGCPWHGARDGLRLHGFGGDAASLPQILSDLSGVPVDDIHAARLEGESMLDVAEANGVAGDELTAAAVGARTAAIDALVEAGTVTQERADAVKARLTERVEAMLARSGSGPTGGGRSWRGAGTGVFGRHAGVRARAGVGPWMPFNGGPFGPGAQA